MLYENTVKRVIYICEAEIKENVERKLLSPKDICLDGRLNSFNDSFKNRFTFLTTDEWETRATEF